MAVDISDDIVCLVCSTRFRTLGSHLRRRHGMSTADYLKLFPTAETVSGSMCTVFSVATQRVRDANLDIGQRVSKTLISNYRSNPAIRGRISEALLRTYAGNAALHERLSESHVGFVHSESTRRLLSVKAKERWDDTVYAQTQSEAIARVRRDNPEIGRKISRALIGHKVSNETRQLLSKANLGREVLESVRLSQSRSMVERWKDSEYAQHVFDGMVRSTSRRPNGSELQLKSTLDRYFPSTFKYVGDSKLWIGRHNPDFVDTLGKFLIVEMFGEYSHNPLLFPKRPSELELIDYYAQYGYKCVVFWEYDVWCNESAIVIEVGDLLAGIKDPTKYVTEVSKR